MRLRNVAFPILIGLHRFLYFLSMVPFPLLSGFLLLFGSFLVSSILVYFWVSAFLVFLMSLNVNPNTDILHHGIGNAFIETLRLLIGGGQGNQRVDLPLL